MSAPRDDWNALRPNIALAGLSDNAEQLAINLSKIRRPGDCHLSGLTRRMGAGEAQGVWLGVVC